VHFNEEVEVQIVESPAVEVVEVDEVGFLLTFVSSLCTKLVEVLLSTNVFLLELHKLAVSCEINR